MESINAETFLSVFRGIMKYGHESSPRGQRIIEQEDKMFAIDPRFPIMNFEDRNVNIDYFKREWIWKLSGDRYDDSIAKYAKAWGGLKDVDGGYNSNYGQYFFGKQNGFDWVVKELIRDKDSRRAIILLLNDEHLRTNNPDHVCTFSVGFRIRDNHLNMSVNMRSNDFIWGFTNDSFTFCMLYRLVYGYLKHFYPQLKIGLYTHKADSLHIYERHWDMTNKIISGGVAKYTPLVIPFPASLTEVQYIIATGCTTTADTIDTAKFDLYNWIKS